MTVANTKRRAPSLPQLITLVLWCGCVAIGIAGLCLRYIAPSGTISPPETVQAELLTVAVMQEPDQPPGATPAPQSALPSNVVPAAPPLPAVAAPTPAIAFSLPLEGPTQTVDAAHASFARPRSDTPAVQRLTFGRGEGAQPAPEYPSDAVSAGEEGAVGVRFTVAADGRVIGAKVVSPSRWPLLNNAALQVIQERWRFAGGAARTYEVSIRFRINR